jgi:hypothetical protein
LQAPPSGRPSLAIVRRDALKVVYSRGINTEIPHKMKDSEEQLAPRLTVPFQGELNDGEAHFEGE